MGKDNLNKYVFSLDLRDESVRDDVTSGVRLFHVLAAAMENARSPMVRRRVRGTYGSFIHSFFYLLKGLQHNTIVK